MRMLLKGLQPDTMYLVQLRTRDGGRVSPWSQIFELQTKRDETPPNPVTNLSGTFSEGNLAVYWEAPTHSADGNELLDFKDYKVTIGPSPADPEWRLVEVYTESTQFEFTKEDNVAAFGRFRPGLSITVEARDLVGNLSTPVTITKTKPRPNPVTGLTWASVGNAFSGSWTPPTTNTDGSVFTDPAGFEVKVIYATNNVRTYNSSVPKFDYSYEQNKADFGGVENTAKTPLTLQVRARDSVGQLSDPVSLEAGNAPPSKPTGVSAAPVSEGIRVTWTANPEDDIAAYEIWSAGAATGAGTLFGRVGANQREYIHQTVAYDQDHYLYVTAVDVFNSRSPESDRSGPHRPKSPFTVDTTPPAATTLTAATPTRGQTEPAAVALSWPAVTADDLAGYHIRYSRATDTTRSWEYYDVIDKAATSVTIEGLFSQTAYAFQIRSYDTMINPSAWSAEATATSSKSEVPPMTEISSNISVISGGVLRSANYDETNQTGWRLMDTSLDILSGRVNARVVSAGTLVSSVNVTTDGTTQPAWSLNLAGNASINDAQVRGKIVVGNAAGTANASVAIASHNYGGTGSQWAIKGDGSIDLKAGATDAAGAPIANSLHISSTGIVGRDANGNQRFIVNTSGQFHLSTTNGGLVMDDNGLRIYSGATVMVDLNRNGSATFTGTVTANAGAVGNWSIDTYGIHAGSLSIRSDLGMIYSGSTTSRVAMRAGYGFWAGADDHASAPFRVDTAGNLTSTKGTIGGWTINATSLSGTGIISGGEITGATITGGKIQTSATAANRVVIAPNDGIDIYFYSSHSSSPGFIDTRGRTSGSALNRDTYMTLMSPQNSAFTTRPYIQMRSLEGSGNHVYYDAGGGNHHFRNYVRFDNRPYLNGVGYIETQGHGHDYAPSSHSHAVSHTSVAIDNSFLNDAPLYIRSSGDGNHRIEYGQLGTNYDGPDIRGHAHIGFIVNTYSSTAYHSRMDSGGLIVRGTLYSSLREGKDEIQPLRGEAAGVKEKLKKLRPVKYKRKDLAHLPASADKMHVGLIAEEVAEAFPELAGYDADTGELVGVQYHLLSVPLLEAVQGLMDEVTQLRAEVESLKTK